jgi:protein-S-isoprenylcysteine O-methyltransferase Ste14
MQIDVDLYTTTMQMVPLLLIALFVDNRDDDDRSSTRRRWQRVQDKTYALLAVAAFFTSMFVTSRVIDSSRFTTAIVLAALSGTMTLLLLQIWRRFNPRRRSDQETGPDGPHP